MESALRPIFYVALVVVVIVVIYNVVQGYREAQFLEQKDQTSQVRLAKGQIVSLSWGSLALIALLLLFFSNAIVSEIVSVLRNEVRQVDQKVERLENKVDEITKKVNEKK